MADLIRHPMSYFNELFRIPAWVTLTKKRLLPQILHSQRSLWFPD